MNPCSATLSVWAGEQVACVKVVGRANFTCSVDFKKLMQYLQQRGYHDIALDLSECLLMDSTFLGVLASIGFKASSGCNGRLSIELLNPNQRIRDLVENLGITVLFKVLDCVPASPDQFEPVQPADRTSKEELTRTCLDAHLMLMNVNPTNVPKFKDVADFFAEELKKHQQAQPVTDVPAETKLS